MKLRLDFSVIIAVLVLAQLYILNIKVKVDTNIESNNKGKEKDPSPAVEKINEGHSDDEDMYLVVHRNNGEEKIYTKKDVA